VHVDVDGLEPETHYYYAFSALGASSPVARTRTLPQETDHLRFAMMSCAKFQRWFLQRVRANCSASRPQLLIAPR
jgi:alkaline phosphatase D